MKPGERKLETAYLGSKNKQAQYSAHFAEDSICITFLVIETKLFITGII